jgi:hypothetical protein
VNYQHIYHAGNFTEVVKHAVLLLIIEYLHKKPVSEPTADTKFKLISKFLMSLGASSKKAWTLAKAGEGWWRLSKSLFLHQAMTNTWFEEQGLINLTKQRASLNV